MGKLGDKATGLLAVPESVHESGFVEVECWAKEYLGVFKNDSGKWQIFHSITGYKVRSYDTRKEAIEVRNRLVDSEIDWEFTDPKILASQEIAQLVQQIQSEYEASKSLGNVAQIGRGEEMLKVPEVVEELGISKSTVYNYITTGKPPSVKPAKERLILRRDV